MKSFSEDLADLSNKKYVENDPFESLATVSDYLNNDRADEARELLYHLLDHDVIPESLREFQNSLLEAAGLYPYLDSNELKWSADQINYEAHRPSDTSDVVLHEGQLEAYLYLKNGENVILSAPTSFGKSLLIDVMIATGKYKNVVVIVPTIALIDETRRRLFGKFGQRFKLITHPTQVSGACNIYVLTQERFLELRDIPPIDFFVIDEFYKLNPDADGEYDDRTVSLNVACLKLLRQKGQFLLIGPNIQRVDSGESKVSYKFIRSDFKTVGTTVVRINAAGRLDDATYDVCKMCKNQTLIFCASIPRVYKLGAALCEKGLSAPTEKACEFADWLAENYSPEWSLVRFLRNGIAIHHSSLPRSVSQYLLHLFNKGHVRFLICTSTIIEGVNTAARNIIVYDNKIARKNFDHFTFCNIKGRAGRMFQYWIGNVYVLNPEPQEELPLVEIPALTLSEGIPLSLAVEAGDAAVSKLSSAELDKLKYLHAQKHLPLEIIKKNSPFDPMVQIDVAKLIRENASSCGAKLGWNGLPDKYQLRFLCELIFDRLMGGDKTNGVLSSAQLRFYVINLQNNMPHGIRAYLDALRRCAKGRLPMDEIIRNAFSFMRTWAEFQLPRAVLAIDRIQKHVFSSLHMKSGDYLMYAESLKHWFRHPTETTLEEYGIPMVMTEKIRSKQDLPVSVDELIPVIGGLDAEQFTWTKTERDIYAFAFPKGDW